MMAISDVWRKMFWNFDKLNNAFITLTPKIVGDEQVKDFMPISMVHNFAKLLANWLAGRLNEMISPIQQGSFYPRQLHANPTNGQISLNWTFRRHLIWYLGPFYLR
jgi:hypothetical protein